MSSSHRSPIILSLGQYTIYVFEEIHYIKNKWKLISSSPQADIFGIDDKISVYFLVNI
jgi:hypothetical protein